MSNHDRIHGHRNLNYTERSVIARHRNFNAPKICKITVNASASGFWQRKTARKKLGCASVFMTVFICHKPSPSHLLYTWKVSLDTLTTWQLGHFAELGNFRPKIRICWWDYEVGRLLSISDLRSLFQRSALSPNTSRQCTRTPFPKMVALF